MTESRARKQVALCAHERLSELSILMDLRLAFGPGTRLWALRSLEEFCYDWLQFKTHQLHGDFRAFALSLYTREKAYPAPAAGLRAIRRRIASVLKSHQIKRRARAGIIAFAQQPQQIAESFIVALDCVRLTELPPGSDVTLAAATSHSVTNQDGNEAAASQPRASR